MFQLFDLNSFLITLADRFEGLSSMEIAWVLLFDYWLWVVILYIFLVFLAYPEYMHSIWSKWGAANDKQILLAIDVPKRNEQSTQAMENLFDHLQGAHGSFLWWEKYIEGAYQLSFSFELVSIEGNIQFIIRTPTKFRNLVESAVYSQFPQAEITEVNDYANNVPRNFPSDTHVIWGTEWSLSADKHLPIKSYLKFEHKFSEAFVDPMAALLETMSQIGPGEQIWLQIVAQPLEVMWGRKSGEKLIRSMLKIKEPPAKRGLFLTGIDKTFGLLGELTEQVAGFNLESAAAEEKKPDAYSIFMQLPNYQKEQVESIEKKIAKLAFNCKIRHLYIAEKDKKNNSVGVNAIVGSLKQWTDMNANGFKPALSETGTHGAHYMFINRRRTARQNRFMWAYRSRSGVIGMPAKPLCSEELASLWHFPSMLIKSPMLKTINYIKTSAPVSLPMGGLNSGSRITKSKELTEVMEEKARVIPSFDYDSDEFEKQFAKDKAAFEQTRGARAELLQQVEKENAVDLNKRQSEELKAQQAAMATQNVQPVAPVKPKDDQLPGNLPFID